MFPNNLKAIMINGIISVILFIILFTMIYSLIPGEIAQGIKRVIFVIGFIQLTIVSVIMLRYSNQSSGDNKEKMKE